MVRFGSIGLDMCHGYELERILLLRHNFHEAISELVRRLHGPQMPFRIFAIVSRTGFYHILLLLIVRRRLRDSGPVDIAVDVHHPDGPGLQGLAGLQIRDLGARDQPQINPICDTAGTDQPVVAFVDLKLVARNFVPLHVEFDGADSGGIPLAGVKELCVGVDEVREGEVADSREKVHNGFACKKENLYKSAETKAFVK